MLEQLKRLLHEDRENPDSFLPETSFLVEKQLPGFISEEYPQFVNFLKAYYKFFELQKYFLTADSTLLTADDTFGIDQKYLFYYLNRKKIKNITDVDSLTTRFENNFFNVYANLLPRNPEVDKRFLLKNIVPLYLSKGSEKSFKYLFRLLFDEEVDVKYLRDSILRTSSGKWVKNSALNVNLSSVVSKYVADGITKQFYILGNFNKNEIEVSNNDVIITNGFTVYPNYKKIVFDNPPNENTIVKIKYQTIDKNLFTNRNIVGEKSGASAIVESSSFSIVNGNLILKLFLDSTKVNGSFLFGENLLTDVFLEDYNYDKEQKQKQIEQLKKVIFNLEKTKSICGDDIDPLTGKSLVELKQELEDLETQVKPISVILESISELKDITIVDGGAFYNVGDPVIVKTPEAKRNASAIVQRVFFPKIEAFNILNGGAGFKINNKILANQIGEPLVNIRVGYVSSRKTPNTFTIFSDVISDIDPANTLISDSDYNLSIPNSNLYSNLYSSFSNITYYELGEIGDVEVIELKIPFASPPILDALPTTIDIPNIGFTSTNTTVAIDTFGSIGKVTINDGGKNYSIGDELIFTSQPGAFGLGVAAEVSNVNTSGSITSVTFVPDKISGIANVNVAISNVTVIGSGTSFSTELKVGDDIMINLQRKTVSEIISDSTLNVSTAFSSSIVNKPVRLYGKYLIGGQGYEQDKLPNVTVNSVNGTGANLAATAIMGQGDVITAITTPLNGRKVGAIEKIRILDAGRGIITVPEIDLKNYGAGNAIAKAVLYSTYENYEGRWLSTDSLLSSSDRKIQGLNYYFDYSYLLSSNIEYFKYKSILKDIVHPAGYIKYGEIKRKNELSNLNNEIVSSLVTSTKIIQNGLVLHLDAGDTSSYPGSGTVWTDLTGSGNNATLINGPVYSSANGGSIVFDGLNDYMSMEIPNLTNYTLSFWLYINSLPYAGERQIFGAPNDVGSVSLIYSSGWRWHSWGGIPVGMRIGEIVTRGKWYNFAMTRTGSKTNFYVDGQFSRTFNSGVNISSGTGYFCDVEPGGGRYLNGKMSNIAFYNRVLTPAEIYHNHFAFDLKF